MQGAAAMLYRLVNWISNNKVFILCGISFCFFVSTVALARNSSKCSSNLLRNTMNFSQKDYYRLPRSIVPKNYKLKLWPDSITKTFNGSVAIKLEVKEATRRIQLHSNKLAIHSVLFRGSNEQSIPIKSTNTTSDRRELLIVELFEKVPKGAYKIHVNFGGKLDNGIVGFYASSFKNGSGTQTKREPVPILGIMRSLNRKTEHCALAQILNTHIGKLKNYNSRRYIV